MIDQIVQDIQQQGWSYQQKVVDNSRLQLLGPLFESDFRPARIGKDSAQQRAEEIRGDWIKWLDPLDAPELLKPQIQFLNELKSELNQRFYLGIKDFECHLAKYPPGSFYKKHIDRFEKDSSRTISFIFYLHEEWRATDGGELILYNKQNDILKSVIPEPGSLIIFLSEDFPHEVKVCSRERKSLTGWMHTKILN